MLRKTLFALIYATIFFTLNAHANTLKEPENLYFAKQRVTEYCKSGSYDKDIKDTIAKAENYLKTRLKHKNKNEKLAVVLDIDETSISNYPRIKATSYGGTKEDIDNGLKKGDAPVILATLKLYQLAKENNVAVFFVTGRDEKLRTPTIKNLLAAGYKNWDGLYMRPTPYNETYKSIIPLKENARKILTKNGYRIVLNVGDQASDLVGGYAEKNYKLPNPFYYLP